MGDRSYEEALLIIGGQLDTAAAAVVVVVAEQSSGDSMSVSRRPGSGTNSDDGEGSVRKNTSHESESNGSSVARLTVMGSVVVVVVSIVLVLTEAAKSRATGSRSVGGDAVCSTWPFKTTGSSLIVVMLLLFLFVCFLLICISLSPSVV